MALGLWIAGVFSIAGCLGDPQPAARQDEIPLRNPTAPVARQVGVDLSALVGHWQVVQGAGMAPGTGIEITKEGMHLPAEGPLAYDGKGAFATGDVALWLHWMDTDGRTLAIGDPHGRRVWIAERAGSASSADRLKAARDVLKWYGYDLSQLEA